MNDLHFTYDYMKNNILCKLKLLEIDLKYLQLNINS